MGIKEKIRSLFHKAKQEVKVAQGEKAKDKTYSSRRIFNTEEAASDFFESSRKRLFDVNRWSEIPHPLNSDFQLHNSKGERLLEKKPAPDHFIRILLPGPFPENWVKVIDVKDEADSAEFTVTPSEDPREEKNADEVEHFFAPQATSTFKVIRRKNKIYAYEIGKNETANVKQPEAGNRSVLNTFISQGGWAFFQKIQWKNLTDYLVGKTEP